MRNNRFKTSESKQRFSIRKCNVGVVSVLLGLSFAFIAGNQVASADEVANTEAPAAIVEKAPEASAATAAEPEASVAAPEASVAAPEASTAEAKPEATAAPEAATTEVKPEAAAAPEAVTTETKPAATAINVKTDGKWTENEPVLNKDAAEKDATITRNEEKAPDGYKLTEKADFRTFLILSLSGDKEPADKTDKTTGSFNHRFDKDWYIIFSTDVVTDSGKVLAELVDKNDNNRVLEEKELLPSTSPTSVQFDTIKNLVAGSTINANKNFKYEMKNKQHNFTGKDGKTSTIRNLDVLAGVGDSALSTPVYAPVTPERVGVVSNDVSTIIPVKAVDQVTKYVLKGTDTVKEKELASYTQSGGMAGDNYTIPGAADFDKYVLIESPAVNEGILSPSYVKDSFTIRTVPTKSLARVQLITKSDGTSKFMNFVLNPDHTDVENYYKKDNLTADDLKLNEIIDIINNTTLSNDEKVKEIKGLNAPYLLMFISNDVAPNKVSSGPDFLTGEESWSYESKRLWKQLPIKGETQQPPTNTISASLKFFDNQQTDKDWLIRQFELVDRDGNPIDFKGNRLTGNDRVQIGGQYVIMANSYLPASEEAVYYYAEKGGGVNVHYENEDGEEIKDPVVDEKDAKPGTKYDTKDKKEETITKDGKTYEYKEVKNGSDAEDGDIESGKDKKVTYVYKEVKGDVIVKYFDEDGKPLQGVDENKKEVPNTVTDTPSSSLGTDYTTTDNKPKEIVTEDGKTYELIPERTEGVETGKVVRGTTEVKYFYKEVKGDVVVYYEDENGNRLEGVDENNNAVNKTAVDTPLSSTGTDYDTTDKRPKEITTKDGQKYVLVPEKTDGTEKGKVVPGTTEVTYVYKKYVAPKPPTPIDPLTPYIPGSGDPVNPNPGTPDPNKPNPGTPNPGTPDPNQPNPGTPNPGTPDPNQPNPGTPNPNTPDSNKPNGNGNRTPGNNGGRENYRKVVKKNKTNVDKLPQMGNEDTNNFAAIGAVALAGAIGIAATSKRKEEN